MIHIQIINNYNNKLLLNVKSIKSLLNKILNYENINSANLSVILSDKNYLNRLKKNFFNLDQFTDVISFNLNEENEDLDGEIYVSIDDVLSNAKIFNQSIDNEFKRIIIHGLLHLMGYNDKNDKNKNNMTQLENKYIPIEKNTLLTIKC